LSLMTSLNISIKKSFSSKKLALIDSMSVPPLVESAGGSVGVAAATLGLRWSYSGSMEKG
jgi:hypothetical protein